MGIHPRVAGSTGMYLVLFSVINSNAVYVINGILQLWYGCWISAWSIIGTVGGLIVADWFVKKTDDYYSLCFRCHTILCKWCSNEEWRNNGRRLIVDLDKRRNAVLPDGPLKDQSWH